MDGFTEYDDQRLRAALHSATPPVGLRERIRDRLRSEADVLAGLSSAGRSVIGDTATGLASSAVSSSVAESSSLRIEPITKRSRRRQVLTLALALTVAGLLFGWANWNRPFSTEQLASFTLDQLDKMDQSQPAWRTDISAKLVELEILGRKIKPFLPQRYHDLAGGRFAKACRVWEMRSSATNKLFYLLDYDASVDVESLSEQLQSINRASGGMRLYAMQSGDRVLVVAFAGRAEDYLNLPQSV